jgi:hypothetical protein
VIRLKSEPLCRLKVLYCFGTEPKSNVASCWRKNETPRALISGAIRGACRSGRYAKRSIAIPSKPDPTIAAANMSKNRTGIETFGLVAPPSAVSTKYPMYEPIMKTSPCAKLSSFRIP